MKALRPYALLVLLNLGATLAVYAVGAVSWGGEPAPGLSLIHRYWDGPAYAAVAKSLYDPADPVFEVFGAPYGIRVILPVYPLAVRALSPVFGYLDAMLVATFVFSSLVFCVLYRLLDEYRLVADPLWCAAVFVVFPPRWVIYHAVAASEPPFLLFILCTVYFYRKRSLLWCGIFGGLAAISRIYGVLLFPALLLAELFDRQERPTATRMIRLAASLLPIPLFLGIHFAFLWKRIGSFWAYFDENADKMSWVPFRGLFEGGVYHEAAQGVLLFMAAAYGLAWLWRRGQLDLFFVSLLLVLPNVFTTLHDLGRFMVPVYPFLLLIPFGELWSRWEAKWAVGVGIPATYAYVWSAIFVNLIPPEAYERLRAILEAGRG